MNNKIHSLSNASLKTLIRQRFILTDLLMKISEVSEVTVLEIQSKKRKRELADIRAAYMVIARETTSASLGLIASMVNCDHCMVCYAKKTMEVKEKRMIYNEIKTKLGYENNFGMA